jgi:hypothetical protein
MNYIYLVAFVWWFIKFEPLQLAFDYIFKLLPINHFTNRLYEAVGCPKCVGFWAALFITGNFFTACVVSLLSFTLDICLGKIDR